MLNDKSATFTTHVSKIDSARERMGERLIEIEAKTINEF
jgi:hypothetical protein